MSGIGAGENCQGRSTLIEAEASALKMKEEADMLRSKETMSRVSAARQAISSVSSNPVDGFSPEHPIKTASEASVGASNQPEQKNLYEARESLNIPLPFMEASTIGLVGKWKEKYGNYVIFPDADSSYNQGNEVGVVKPPLGVIHFLGGAFVEPLLTPRTDIS